MGEQVWSPPQDLRREVEEQVYRSLVNKRLEAGEDPYPVTYCEQVTKEEYERSKLTGSQAALKDLLDTILKDEKMGQRNKRKKLKKLIQICGGINSQVRKGNLICWPITRRKVAR